MKARKVAVALTIVAFVALAFSACPSPDGGGSGDKIVTIADIPGVYPPVAGEAPVTATTLTAQYTGKVSWSPQVTGGFEGSKLYTATIRLKANPGFTFSGVPANFFTVAGAAAINPAGSNVVTATFLDHRSSLVEMVRIPAGTFTMGSPTNEPNRESNETRHSVTLSGFWMGKYQVTQEQYEDVMGTNPSSFKTSTNGDNPARRPVETVSWYDAIVFCNKLSMREGLSPAYVINGSTDPAAWGPVPVPIPEPPVLTLLAWNAVIIVPGSKGYRLPTEAQWEYACRAGTTTAYNTGASISNNTGWYNSNSGYRTREVGLKPPNTWGLYDMHGNVFEWCWDWYASTYPNTGGTDPTGPAFDPTNPTITTTRVERGGSWGNHGQYLRSAFRGVFSSPGYPVLGSNVLGFRLARP